MGVHWIGASSVHASTIIEDDLEIVGSMASGTINDLPIGEWEVAVWLLGSDGAVLGHGGELVMVLPNQTARVDLVIKISATGSLDLTVRSEPGPGWPGSVSLVPPDRTPVLSHSFSSERPRPLVVFSFEGMENPDAMGAMLYRGDGAETSYQLVNTVQWVHGYIVDSEVELGSVYYYKLLSVAGDGRESDWSIPLRVELRPSTALTLTAPLILVEERRPE